jgi:hypothetical protein
MLGTGDLPGLAHPLARRRLLGWMGAATAGALAIGRLVSFHRAAAVGSGRVNLVASDPGPVIRPRSIDLAFSEQEQPVLARGVQRFGVGGGR